MITQEEMTETADRLTDALTTAAAIMHPDETRALSSPVPGRLASPASGPVRRRPGRLRAWLVPVGAAASVAAIILAAVNLAGHAGTVPAPRTGPGQAPAAAGPGITSLAGVPSVSGARTAPPRFYAIIVSRGITRSGDELMAVQVRRTSDGQVTGTMPALPAGWILGRQISVTADDRTFTVAAETQAVCPSSTATRTRFYQFKVTSTGHVTGVRAVGKLVTGDPVSEFAASPDGTQVAYAVQGCPVPDSVASHAGAIHIMNVTSGAVRSWRNTVSAATPARVTTQIGAMSWTASGRTLAADYLWKLPEGSLDLAVLGLDATSSGGSLQAHSHLLFSQSARCAVCVYTAVINRDGSTLTAAVASPVPPLPGQPAMPRYRLSVVRLSVTTGKPTGILYRSAPSNGTYNDGGLVPVLSADGQEQHWILWNDPEGFGWISGGKLIGFPKAPSGVLAIDW
ncbi:MAG TPA: hypothetical protein VKU77_04460 [Streptosporangiaceae bacterium]|nr:hypothetical protein [Streptosporangiaceae bacterium]